MAEPAPTVTALRARDRGRVEVELNGVRWRVVPLEAVYRAGLTVGCRLERARARTLRSEIRRQEALGVAVGSLRRRPHTAASLDERLERRGIAPLERRRALDTLGRSGLVDDRRFAHVRAASLAERGCGDLLIADDLERHGVDAALATDAIACLEPEAQRAAGIVAKNGLTPKTIRSLAAKGFGEAALEPLVAEIEAGA